MRNGISTITFLTILVYYSPLLPASAEKLAASNKSCDRIKQLKELEQSDTASKFSIIKRILAEKNRETLRVSSDGSETERSSSPLSFELTDTEEGCESLQKLLEKKTQNRPESPSSSGDEHIK